MQAHLSTGTRLVLSEVLVYFSEVLVYYSEVVLIPHCFLSIWGTLISEMLTQHVLLVKVRLREYSDS